MVTRDVQAELVPQFAQWLDKQYNRAFPDYVHRSSSSFGEFLLPGSSSIATPRGDDTIGSPESDGLETSGSHILLSHCIALLTAPLPLRSCDKCGGKGKIVKGTCPVCKGHKVESGEDTITVIVEKGMREGHEIVCAPPRSLARPSLV
jgi:hypothetical protein